MVWRSGLSLFGFLFALFRFLGLFAFTLFSASAFISAGLAFTGPAVTLGEAAFGFTGFPGFSFGCLGCGCELSLDLGRERSGAFDTHFERGIHVVMEVKRHF